MGLSATDTILPMTPMFHANGAWGFTHAAPMVGAKLVLPGPKMDGASIVELIEAEGVTVTAGVRRSMRSCCSSSKRTVEVPAPYSASWWQVRRPRPA